MRRATAFFTRSRAARPRNEHHTGPLSSLTSSAARRRGLSREARLQGWMMELQVRGPVCVRIYTGPVRMHIGTL